MRSKRSYFFTRDFIYITDYYYYFMKDIIRLESIFWKNYKISMPKVNTFYK